MIALTRIPHESLNGILRLCCCSMSVIEAFQSQKKFLVSIIVEAFLTEFAIFEIEIKVFGLTGLKNKLQITLLEFQ